MPPSATTRTLVSVMYANNEVGTVQPIAEFASVAREHGVPDAHRRRAGGRLARRLARRARRRRDQPLRAQTRRAEGHRRAGCPRSAAARAVDPRRRAGTRPPVRHRERGRGGRLRHRAAPGRGRQARQGLRSRQRPRRLHPLGCSSTVPGARLTGHPRAAAAGTAPRSCSPAPAARRCCSSSSSTASSAPAAQRAPPAATSASPVLLAMGIPSSIAQTAVRFTFGPSTNSEQLARVAAAVQRAVASVQQIAG